MSRLYTQVLINALTAQNAAGYFGTLTGDKSSAIYQPSQCTEYGIYVEFDHTSAAGVVVIETASDPSYAGTWAILATVTWSAIDKCHYVALTNAVRTLRARISTAVTSGTVTVTAVANTQS